MKQYRRNTPNDIRTCKFCGMKGLRWDEIAPNKFRLIEPSGGVHDCSQFHEAKTKPASSEQTSDRGSLSRRLNVWAQRWGDFIPVDALNEIDEMLDESATSSTSRR